MRYVMVALFLAACGTRGALDDATTVSPLCRSIGAFTAYAASPERCGAVGAFPVPEGTYPDNAGAISDWLAEQWESDANGWYTALDACGLTDHDAFPEDTATCEANATCLGDNGVIFPSSWDEVDTSAYERVCATDSDGGGEGYEGDTD